MKLIRGVRRTRGAILAALVALMMLGAALPASADTSGRGNGHNPSSGGPQPSNISWE
jgi:hypothetical protein